MTEDDNGLGGIEGWGGLEVREGWMIGDSGTQI